MKITIYELLGMVKDGKAPKKVKWKNNIYTYVYDDDREENIINYYYSEEKHCHLIDGGQHDIRLNDEVEILEEEKKIPEKLKMLNANDHSKEVYYENYSKEEISLDIETLQNWVNKIIDYLDYLKSKGE